MIDSYSVFLHLEVTETLRSLRDAERDRVLRFFHSLTSNPFQSGDFQEVDDRSRTNQVKIIGKLGVVFYTDNADREVRILEVRRADL